jgi:hypothetical protein
MRMRPMLSVTRKFPSGSSATDQGLVSRLVMLSIFGIGEGLDGFGASVWPAKAGFGLRGASPEKRPCAKLHGAIKSASTSGAEAVNLMRGSISATSPPMSFRIYYIC